ncbi:tetratricopeptide repeat protein [Acetobacter sp. LMG 1627]|uniref:Tetratricopeptide repeat protein n=2 Tax=Acetobacter conturbans TaxID=1737472 RepID=A0ABX0K411_9PROT|nr:tetratricopeptide repeat protein [Acetobacter conturbans]
MIVTAHPDCPASIRPSPRFKGPGHSRIIVSTPAALTVALLAALTLPVHHARAVAPSSQPPFVLSDCLATLDDDPGDVDDYVSAHDVIGSTRAVRHCRAIADALMGNAATSAEELDGLAHTAAAHMPETDDDSPEERADVAADAARAWFAAGAPTRAENSAGYGLTLTPDSIALRLLRDRALLQTDHPDDALRDLTELDSNPVLETDIHRLKAKAEIQTGKFTAAEQDIAFTLSRTPDDPGALLERGIVRQRLNNPAGARSDWEQVIALAPDSHEADLARQDLDLLASDPDALPPSDVTIQTSSSH